jgi:hypothetical protein
MFFIIQLYKLKKLVSENKINWSYLCLNPNAIEFIKNIDKKD